MGVKPIGEVVSQAKSAADKALAIDPANSQAHSVLAVVAGIFDYDWEAAERHHRKAMNAEPVHPTVRFRYAVFYLLRLGRFADAREQCRLALESDPLSMFLHIGMALSILAVRQHAEAIKYLCRAMEIDGNYYMMWLVLGSRK